MIMTKIPIFILAITTCVAAIAAEDDAASGTDIQLLLKQSEFWQSQQRQDMAKDSLKRILLTSPDNIEALYRLALIAIQEEDEEAANELIDKLAQVAPEHKYLLDLSIARQSNLDYGALKEARFLAANGEPERAIQKYETLFTGDVPPANLTVEYYSVLSATDDGWETAKDGLAKFARENPDNTYAAVAYGEVLTYSETSRRAGIKLLSNYAQRAPEADKAWRNALLWLGATEGDKPIYDAYMQTHSDDNEVAAYFEDKTKLSGAQQAARLRARGYREMDSGQLTKAKKSFSEALKLDKSDAEAVAGLGLVELKFNRYQSASDYLNQAVRLAPSKRAQWQNALESASFYGELKAVREQADKRQFQTALARVEPLTNAQGTMRRDALLLKAELLQRLQKLDAAETVYSSLLKGNTKDTDARAGLVNVLRQQQRWQEAGQVAQLLPESARGTLSEIASGQAMTLRERASAEPDKVAEVTLRRAQELSPENPWVRLDLARLLNRSGRDIAAWLMVQRAADRYGTDDDLYVAAMVASDQERWDSAMKLLQKIPANRVSEEQKALTEKLSLNARIAEIERRFAAGDRTGGRELMLDLYNQPPANASGTGSVASLLFDYGEPEMAMQLIRESRPGDETAPAGDFLQQIIVMIKAGDDTGAESLLTRLSKRRNLSPSDWQAIEEIRNAVSVAKADKLRDKEDFAQAYDLLAGRLRISPEDESLLLAMARLYQSGGKPSKGLEIYQYVLTEYPDSLDALGGIVDAAIALDELDLAYEAMDDLSKERAQKPEILLLAAKLARADGDTGLAIELLEESRQRLLKTDIATPWLAGNTYGNSYVNPFADNDEAVLSEKQTRPLWLPDGDGNASEQYSWDIKKANKPLTLVQQIDFMLAEMQHEDATTVQSGIAFRTRSGESGLSKLTMITAPVSVDTSLGSGRIQLKMTPTYLNGGNPDSEFGKMGSGAFAVAGQGLTETLDELPDILDSIENSAYAYEEANALYQAALLVDDISPLTLVQYQLDAEQAERNFEQATQQDLLEAMGLNLDALTEEQLASFDGVLSELAEITNGALSFESVDAFLESRAELESMIGGFRAQLNSLAYLAGNPEAQHDEGVAFEIEYLNRNFSADIGVTPLGFEKTNLVGGIRWQPQLSTFTRASLELERRAVTDSVLSYAGTKDPMTGEFWGAVTKTGLDLGLGFDNTWSGMYGNIAGYQYSGSGVEDNTAFEIAVGGYLRPLKNAESELQTGVHLSFQAFEKNLGKFSYGHGGYFSPQGYVALALPVTYSGVGDNYDFSVSFAPGFQSFTEDAVAYFPDDPVLQNLLDLAAQAGLVRESVYQANSKSGFGMRLNLKGVYEFSPAFTLTGDLGFDNFGNFRETNARINLNYLMDAQDD